MAPHPPPEAPGVLPQAPPPDGPGAAERREPDAALPWVVLILALTPPLLAVWVHPGFVTQDGPAHLYNAAILNDALRGGPEYGSAFAVRWSPLPNWSGHALLMGLLALVPPRVADRLATTIPVLALAASTLWLRLRVAGRSGAVAASLLIAVISLNVAWLFGFTSFLLGAAVAPIAWGVWWGGRDGIGPGRALGLAGLVVLGYFGHLVSLGLMVGGLGVLAIVTPGPARGRRLAWTLAGLSPLVVLLPVYRGLMTAGGPLRPIWGHLKDPGSLASWREQLGWADPISLGRKDAFPGLAIHSPWLGPASPAALLLAGLALAVAASRVGRQGRAWPVLAALLIVGGLLTPDTLGEGHGNYLPLRVVLLGLVSLAAWIELDASRWSGRVAVALIAASLAVQTLWAWDYARESDRLVRPFLRAAEHSGFHRRIGTLLIDPRGRHRANPLLHADNLLGLGTGHVLWSDYETAHYYFPVQFREGLSRPPAPEFEAIAKLDAPADRDRRALAWLRLLEEHGREIDLLLVWGSDPALEAITARRFDRAAIFEDGPLRVLPRR